MWRSADKLSREGFGTGWVRFWDAQDRLLWCADASRDGQRWIVHAEKLSAAFLELERQTRDFTRSPAAR